MSSLMRSLYTAVIILTCIVTFSGEKLYARDTELPGSFIIADSDGVSVSDGGGYMVTILDIVPGDIFTKTITIRNLEEGSSINLYMTIGLVESAGPVNLTEKCRLTVEFDGTAIYDAPIGGDRTGILSSEPLNLGKYDYGDSKVMKMTFTFDDDWTIGYEQSKVSFQWNFSGVKDEKNKPVETGEFLKCSFYALCISMTIAVFMLLIIYKLRKHEVV